MSMETEFDRFLQTILTTINHGTEDEISDLTFIVDSLAQQIAAQGVGDVIRDIILFPLVSLRGKDFAAAIHKIDTLPDADQLKYAATGYDGINVEGVVSLNYEGDGEKFGLTAPFGKVNGEYKLLIGNG
jgi:hypothetical protein